MGLRRSISALICLSVISLNSTAADKPSLDLLIEQSQADAQLIIQDKIQTNNKLIAEISDLEKQIATLKSDIAINRKDTKRNLYIAAGTALGTILALKYFARGTGSEVRDSIRILFGILTAYTGAGVTAISVGASGVNYFLVHIDEKNLLLLEQKLVDYKNQLVSQNANLMK